MSNTADFSYHRGQTWVQGRAGHEEYGEHIRPENGHGFPH